jgi:hypothetical protein
MPNAIYQWHSTSPGTYVTATGGELVFTNAAYFSGSTDFYVNDPDTSPWVHYGNFPNYRITNSPVISASLIFELTDGGWAPAVYSDPGSILFSELQFPFRSAVTFNDDGTLTGDLFLYDESDEARASGTNYSWDVYSYGSDYFSGAPECGPPTCGGGSGYWQLARVTVPEPPVWPLIGLGVLALFGLRRKA